MAVLTFRPRRGTALGALDRLRRVPRSQVLALAALAALLLVNVAIRPGFLDLTVRDGAVQGPVIALIRDSAPLMLVSLGMLLVVATRGIDFSVGAVVAVSGAVTCVTITASGDPASPEALGAGLLLGLAVGVALGAWNGLLVSVLGVQPIVATLVLMLAGRGLALMVTSGRITTVPSHLFAALSEGAVLGLPFPAVVATVVVLLVTLGLRRTAVGLSISATGANPRASRLAGLRVRPILWGVYALSGLLAGVAGVLTSANVVAADAANAGLGLEVQAVLAVVVGGTSLRGGRFSVIGTVLGVAVVQTLTSTVTAVGTSPATAPLFEGLLIVVVCLAQSPVLQERVVRARRTALRRGRAERVETLR